MRQDRSELMQYATMINYAYSEMSISERIALESWERDNVSGGDKATSDWPGWVKFIGLFTIPKQIKKRQQRKPTPFKTRHFVFNRDGNKCLHCGTSEELTIDHIIPLCRNGADNKVNMQTLCKSCNCKKGRN